jgi:branched-chain amino acid transport system permease protein
MNRLLSRRLRTRLLLGFLAALVVVAALGLSLQTVVLGVIAGSIYALIAAGVTLVYKASKVLNFAQAEIGTFSLYATWWVSAKHHQPWIVGALAAIGVAVVIGLVFERVIIRPMYDAPRVTVAVATIGLLTLAATLELVWFGPSPRQLPAPLTHGGFQLGGVYVSPSEWLALLVVVVVATALAAFLRFTDFGLGVLASADDPVAARLMGVPQTRVSAFTWAAAGALSALAALLIEPTVGVLAPGAFAGLFIGGLTAALLGGLTSLPGAFVGGLVVGVLEADVKANVISTSLPGVNSLAMLGIVLLVLLVRPQGILGRAR